MLAWIVHAHLVHCSPSNLLLVHSLGVPTLIPHPSLYIYPLKALKACS